MYECPCICLFMPGNFYAFLPNSMEVGSLLHSQNASDLAFLHLKSSWGRRKAEIITKEKLNMEELLCFCSPRSTVEGKRKNFYQSRMWDFQLLGSAYGRWKSEYGN